MSVRDTIVEFLRSIGIPVSAGELTEECFLPGIKISGGEIVFDPERMLYAGDLLHEAGHLAVLPGAVRSQFGEEDGPAIDMGRLEVQAMAWSYAAALHLGLDPAIVFHDGGYHGHAPGLLRGFSLGVYYGAPDLEAVGLTVTPTSAARLGIPPFPHMIRWLRE
ncbi:MAG TPA: hypothetical protein VGI87_04120 [Solirubrobacteraceae bacterium]|jgi:hypothetical protein